MARTFTSPSPTASPQTAAHLLAIRRDLRLLADEHAVRIDQPPPGLADLAVSLTEEVERRRPAERLLARREERADVAEAGGSEERIDQRMRKHIAVRMAGKATRMFERDASEHERRTDVERVRVDSDPDAVAHRSAPGSSSRLEIETASGGGACKSPHGPRRMCTAVIPAASAGPTSLSTRSPT